MKEENTLVTLETPMGELKDKLIEETDLDKLQNIISIFNLNIQKKNIVRTLKLSDLQDKITEQIDERLDKKAGEFSNKDLLDYFKVVNDSITKTDKTLDSIDTPSIQINQNQLNINVQEDELDRASREKVANAVRAILERTSTINPEDIVNIEDIEDVGESIEEDGTIQEVTE